MTVAKPRTGEELKETGIASLGAIPKAWDLQRLRFLADLNPSKSELTSSDHELDATFLPMEAVGEDGSLDGSQTRVVADVYQGYTYFRDGDVLVAKITPCFENGKGTVATGLVNGIGFGTTEFHVLRPHRIDRRLLWYVTASERFRVLGESEMKGSAGQKRVPEDFVKDFLVPLPSVPEQQAIAAFLDRETAKIDALIAQKERLIELLGEQRAAVITRAVTKGLDPSVPMKGSGVEWLGEVPAHWKVRRIKQVAKMDSGHTPDKSKPEYWDGGNIPWVSLNDTARLAANEYIEETAVCTTAEGLANSSAHLLPAEAVVFSRDATIGRCAITTVPMAVSQHFIAWISGPLVLPQYLLQVLRSDLMQQHLVSLTMGSTVKTIGMPDVRSLVMPVPPPSEQREIVKHIQAANDRTDRMVAAARTATARLREYRTALISAAVTGKIDVREEVA